MSLENSEGCVLGSVIWIMVGGVAPYNSGTYTSVTFIVVGLASTGMNVEMVLSINRYCSASYSGALIIISKSICLRRNPRVWFDTHVK